ncbi:MAG TPA: phospholipid carrier-dependent glycosyltransferase [Candidatus Binatia bacterium]|nr:phospholipid carrier-dependent glycosyltransferase [Candidatus Binatia bacterium]
MSDSTDLAPAREPTSARPPFDHPRTSGTRKIAAILILIAALASLTSVLYFAHFHDLYTDDSPGYIRPATNLLAGNGFTDAQGHPDILRTPGYPLVILPFLWAHLDLKYLVLFQHLLRVLIIVASAAFAFQLTRSRRQALLVGILLSIDLPFLRSANNVMTEIVFTLFLGIALKLLFTESSKSSQRMIHLVAAGLICGATVLIRPVSIFLFVPVAIYLLAVRRSQGWLAAFAFSAAFLCLPLAWAARNEIKAGYFGVSSISGYSILQYRAAGVLAINDPGDFYVNLEKRQSELEGQACQELQRLRGTDCAQMSDPAKSAYFAQFGRRIVARHPLAYIKLALRGFGMMMLTGSPASLSGMTGLSFGVAAKILLLYTVPCLGLALFGLQQYWNMNRAFFWLAALVIGYFVAVSCGAETFARFRIPILPLYSILIALGIGSVWQRISPGRRDLVARPAGDISS